MTPEKWQAVTIGLCVTVALVVVITVALERLSIGKTWRIATALLLIAGYFSVVVYFDRPYWEVPVIAGVKTALLALGATQIGLVFARKPRSNAA